MPPESAWLAEVRPLVAVRSSLRSGGGYPLAPAVEVVASAPVAAALLHAGPRPPES